MAELRDYSLLTNKIEPPDFKEHSITDNWLLVIFQSKIKFSYDGQIFTDEPQNSMVLYSPGQLHAYQSNDEKFLNSFLLFSTEKAYFDQFKFPINQIFSVSEERINYIINALDQISYLLNTPKEPLLKKKIPDMLTYVFSIIDTAYDEAQKNPNTINSVFSTMSSIRNMMFNNPVRYTVQNMALISGFSETYFGIQYKKYFGITPCKDRQKQIIKVIKNYLETSNLSLERIAELCEIESVPYMIQLFKSFENIPPHQYRILHQKR